MPTFLDSSQLDFTAYRNSLKDYLKGQSQFKDYDFDGPNMAVMLDLLARNTYHNGFYLNMIGSEMFLDTAQQRESVVSKAKELNYVPRSRNSSKALVNILIAPTDSPHIITIPKFYTMTAGAAGDSFTFSTDEVITVRSNGGLYQARGVEVFEGRVVTETFVAGTNTRYFIASPNIDISSIDVQVQNSITDTATSTWTRAYNLYGLTDVSEVFFVQGARDNFYEIIFGNGITGKAVTQGNVIRVTYRDTSGLNGDGLRSFKPVRNIDGYANITITSFDGVPSFGGAERESIESIKFNAPRYFASQERAVTKGDYLALIRAEFPQIDTIAVFGGEELEQKRYGKVVLSVKPHGSDKAPTSLTNLIQNYISTRCPVAIDPIFIDPEYFYIGVNTVVSYNPLVGSKSVNEITATVLAAIGDYSQTNLYDFASDLRYSRLCAAIDNADPAVVSNDTSLAAIKRIAPARQTASSMSFTYNNPIKLITNQSTVFSSTFYYRVNDETVLLAYLEDDAVGNINIVTINNVGVKIILQKNVGTVSYSTGKVTLTNILYEDYVGYINIYMIPANKDYVISQNQIILIDPIDVSITIQQALF